MKTSTTLFNYIQYLIIFIFSFLALPIHAAEYLVFENVNYIDVKAEQAELYKTVVIYENRIVDIDDVGDIEIPYDATVIDASGKYLIPGLWDMHTHVAQLSYVDGFANHKEVMLPSFIAYGVIGIRDMGGQWPLLQAWKQEISDKTLIGPRIIGTHLMLDGPGTFFEGTIPLHSKEEARQVAQEFVDMGVDFLKVQSLITPEAYEGVVEIAEEADIPVVGHVPWQLDAIDFAKSGAASNEHITGVLFKTQSHPFVAGEFNSDRKIKKIIKKFKKHNVWQCTTHIWLQGLSVPFEHEKPLNEGPMQYIPRYWVDNLWRPLLGFLDGGRNEEDKIVIKRNFQRRLEVARQMKEAGIPFIAGTDVSAAFILPGFSLHEELAYQVRAGLKPIEALQSATLNPAIFLEMEDDLGSIEIGKIADLVLIDADPLHDIRNTQKISGVFYNGDYFDSQDLENMFNDIKVAAGN